MQMQVQINISSLFGFCFFLPRFDFLFPLAKFQQLAGGQNRFVNVTFFVSYSPIFEHTNPLS